MRPAKSIIKRMQRIERRRLAFKAKMYPIIDREGPVVIEGDRTHVEPGSIGALGLIGMMAQAALLKRQGHALAMRGGKR